MSYEVKKTTYLGSYLGSAAVSAGYTSVPSSSAVASLVRQGLLREGQATGPAALATTMVALTAFARRTNVDWLVGLAPTAGGFLMQTAMATALAGPRVAPRPNVPPPVPVETPVVFTPETSSDPLAVFGQVPWWAYGIGGLAVAFAGYEFIVRPRLAKGATRVKAATAKTAKKLSAARAAYRSAA